MGAIFTVGEKKLASL